MRLSFLLSLIMVFTTAIVWANSDAKADSMKNPTPSILIFVSFSMPTQSLETYLREAKKIKASVVIRGLIDNSFQKTFQRMADLIKASGGDGVELNPLWFKQFNIQAVPTIVVVPVGSACYREEICKKGKDYDVMMGNITLSSALRIIRDRDKASKEIAQSAIQKLEMASYA